MKAQPSRLAAPNPRLACRILLVEDDQDHQPLLSLMLRKADAEVAIAENGQVAIDLASAARKLERPFDMILMDVQMPVLDGFAATRELRDAGFDVPIIALTARSGTTDRAKCLAAGCDDFLAKPVSRTDMIRLLAAHLTRYRAQRAATSSNHSVA